LRTIPGNNNGVTSVAFSPDQGEIAAGAGDREYNGSVRFFSVSTGQLLGIWLQDPNNPSSYVTTVVYGPFGRSFAYARADTLVTLAWNPF
ncbi:MAG: WD40 repeat domain-containing protein, partial [Thermoanaerobaculia bacterium]